jgi:hypothetical protein
MDTTGKYLVLIEEKRASYNKCSCQLLLNFNTQDEAMEYLRDNYLYEDMTPKDNIKITIWGEIASWFYLTGEPED